MNDEEFIIISSDEDIDSSSIPKEQQVSFPEGSEQTVIFVADCSEKQNSVFQPNMKEKAQCLQVVLHDKNNGLSSQNTKLDISTDDGEKSIVKQVLKFPENAKNQTDIETNVDKNNENDKDEKVPDTYEKFLQLVLSMEVKEEDKQKLKKKITKYYDLADPEYCKSDEFYNLLENCMSKLNIKQSLLYPIVKEVLDCLLAHRVLTVCRKLQKMKSSGGEGYSSGEISGKSHNHEKDLFFDTNEKNFKTVKKLTKVLRTLGKKIKELEETEVDLSDEEDSSYFKMQRYRERFCQVYKKLCAYTDQKANAKQMCARKICFNGSNNLQLDRAIEWWLNKTMQFPDYSSVHKFITKSNENLQLGFSKGSLEKMAVDIFARIGSSMQLRRKYDLWESFNSFLDNDVDPSETDEALRERLNANFEAAAKKEKEILNYYADLQTRNKLEPVDVPDEEANCSPVESGDEIENEIEAIENKLNSRDPIEVEEIEGESDTDENDQESVDSVVTSEVQTLNRDSPNSATSSKPECVSDYVDSDERDKIVWKSEADASDDNVKDLSRETVEKYEGRMMGTKRSPDDVEITHFLKKPKLTEGEVLDNDSDCEIVLVVSDDETDFKSKKNSGQEMKRMHQINYTFINNSFNYNALLTLNDLALKRKNTYSSFKCGKTQRKSLPFSDLTNIKHITNKYARSRGGMEKKKIQESIRLHPLEKFRLRKSKSICPDKMSNHCALRNGSSKGNVKSNKESDQGKEGDPCETNSNDGTINSPNNNGSGGGNGQNNNNDNGDKNPSDKGKEADENQEPEDEEEEEEEGKNVESEIGVNDPIKDEGNGLNPESEEGGKNEDLAADDYFVSPQQLVCVTIDLPEPKRRKSATPRSRRLPSKTTRARRNGGLPSTSKPVPARNSYNYKPQVVKSPMPRKSFSLNSSQVEMLASQQRKQSARTVKSDEEIVKNFLQHSPSSISITSPRNLLIENKPSPSTLQAIQTLSRLKGITTTVVKASCPGTEDDVTVIEESPKRSRGSASPSAKPRRSDSFVLPKIVTVQGNVTGFENMSTDDNFTSKKAPCPCRRKVQRSQSGNRSSDSGNTSNSSAGQQPTKNVEYVVLD